MASSAPSAPEPAEKTRTLSAADSDSTGKSKRSAHTGLRVPFRAPEACLSRPTLSFASGLVVEEPPTPPFEPTRMVLRTFRHIFPASPSGGSPRARISTTRSSLAGSPATLARHHGSSASACSGMAMSALVSSSAEKV